MDLGRRNEPSVDQPFFLVYVFPLIVEVAIAVGYVTGFVTIGYSGYRSGPSYGFPLPYRTSFCETLPCAAFLNWTAFWIDVIFYIGLQYVLMIFYSAHLGKIPRPSLSQLQDPGLAIPFGLAVFGAALMISVPLFIPTSPSVGVVCLDPSPCLTQQNYYRTTLNLTWTIWVFSSIITLFVGLIIGLAGKLGRQFLGVLLVSLAGVYIMGVETLLTSGVTAYLNLGSIQVFEIAFSLSIAPLLVFLSAMILATRRTQFTSIRTS